LGDAARTLEIPVVGGNVSFYNESDEFGTAIAPTPSIGMVGWIKDLDKIPGSTFQQADETIILIGETLAEMGASEYFSLLGYSESGVPPCVPENINTIVDNVISIVESGLIAAAHDVSNGGLAITLCEMVDSVGAVVDISGMDLREDEVLFSESYGRLVISTKQPEKVLTMLSGIPCKVIGKTKGTVLSILSEKEKIIVSFDEIKEARATLTHQMMD
jgi:phosphoribosylformylglycinamidine (FGAM) synthase-like enzyme